MTRLPELLERAVGTIEPTFEIDDVVERAARRHRTRARRRALASVLVVAAVTSVAILAREGGAHRVQVVTTTPTSTPLAASPNDVLLFDETGGVVAVDPANRTVTRVPVKGWRPGDQPYVSRLVDGNLVVGWGDVYATPIAGGASHLLGTGVFVPAAEPGAVWLTSYGQVQTPTERLVDMQGHVLEHGAVPGSSSVALVGVPGGLAFQTPTGLDIWDAGSGRITRHLGAKSGFAAPPHGSLLPWCDECDRALELTDLATGVTREIRIPLDGELDTINRAEFSPDGTQLAIVSTAPANKAGNGTASIVVIDVASAAVVDQFDTGRRYATFAWSADGHRLYAAVSDSGDAGEVFAYDLASGRSTDLGPEPSGAYGITGVVRYGAASGVVSRKKPGAAASCPAPVVSSDNTTRACSYRY